MNNNNRINNNAFHKLLVQIAKPEKERESNANNN
jgi:hypothetical protein